ncbi:hypothetical protein Agub_g4638 [Astrephomene gubernaculifera]|uniref:F-box domain-containing protein n=1 Tax=Astrephomene gubernaculifera TaxID=47775 RepID=A0AAD3DKG4_9CHLO|nr:hypothetical protein Agub_g4638 [Astrephomene gubernaculifera]
MAGVVAADQGKRSGFGRLPSDVVEGILGFLTKDVDSLLAIRVTCTAMCDLVDRRFTKCCMTLLPDHLEELLKGERPSLTRFANLATVCFKFELGRRFRASDAVLLATQPFQQLSLEARHRVARLELVQDKKDAVPCAEIIVSALVQLLPGLQQLDMREFHGMSYSEPHQRDMYGSLAACLPQLHWLSIPSCYAASGLAFLANKGGNNLRHLEVSGHYRVRMRDNLDPSAITTISMLSGLRELHLRRCSLPQSTWQLLWGSLPASLQRLVLDEWGEVGGFRASSLHVRLNTGRLVAVDLLQCYGGAHHMLREVRQLMSGLTEGGSFQEALDLRIGVVDLSHVQRPERMEDLRQLGSIFARVHVKKLFWERTSPDIVNQLIEQLGLPEIICYSVVGRYVQFAIRTQDAGVRVPQVSGEGQQQQQRRRSDLQPMQAAGGSQALQLPSGGELLSLAVQRMVPEATSSITYPPASAPGASVPQHYCQRHFIMRGPASKRRRIMQLPRDAMDRGDVAVFGHFFQAGGTVYACVTCLNGKSAAAVAAAANARAVDVLPIDSSRCSHCASIMETCIAEVMQETWSAAHDPADPSSRRQLVEWLARLDREVVYLSNGEIHETDSEGDETDSGGDETDSEGD